MSGKIALVVDDAQPIRAYLKLFLRRAGFHTIEAANGLEALDVLRKLGRVVDLVVSDVLMPQIDGVALVHAVRAEFPTTPIVLFSGYVNATHMRDLNIEFLQKPFPPAALLAAIARAIDAITTTRKKEPQSETRPAQPEWDATRERNG